MATSENTIDIENREGIVNIAKLEMEFRKDKCRAKSNFTRSKNKLLLLLEDQELPSRRDIHGACKRMDSCMDIVLEVLSNFSEFYIHNNELQKSQKIISEMENIEEDFQTAYEAARDCLDSRKDGRSSISSDTLSVDLLQRMNITDDRSETYQTEKIFAAESQRNIGRSLPLTEKPHSCTPVSDEAQLSTNARGHLQSYESPDTGYHDLSNAAPGSQDPFVENKHSVKQEEKTTILDVNAASFQPDDQATHMKSAPVVNHDMPSIGQDLWRQLKRVQIPVFSGDKKSYQNWKAAFLACIDSAPAKGEYKLLQLRQYLSGEAHKAIENLGHSAVAYEAAKERLERKYGGKRRQIAIYLEELEQFQQIRLGNAKDLEQFADLLDVAMINLKEAGQHHELGDGSLYTKLQRKLPECMLARYHRWIFENGQSESVITLRTWIIQESEFQTIASETVRGFAGNDRNTQITQPMPKYRHQRTLFNETWGSHSENISVCKSEVTAQNQTERRLLDSTEPKQERPEPSSHPVDLSTSGTEGKWEEMQTTMMVQECIEPEFIALRTVPVMLKNGDRYLKVNALLDDASTKTYINADIAEELGLHGKTENVTVNVLNGQAKSFETKTVQFKLESVNGHVNTNVKAYTVDRVTGNMNVIDWNKLKQSWPYLERIDFPRTATRPIVDILIGLDSAELHCAVQEIRGRPGEPIARLTPLGWTCIGHVLLDDRQVLRTNFAYTYFSRDQSVIRKANVGNSEIKTLREIEDKSSLKEASILQIDEQLAMKKIKEPTDCDSQMYQVRLPCEQKENCNKKLRRSPQIAKDYNEGAVRDMGLVRKSRQHEKLKSKQNFSLGPVIRLHLETHDTRAVVFGMSSSNKKIYRGPKLQESQSDVLRLPASSGCDIGEPSYRIVLIPENKPYQGLLRRGTGENRQPKVKANQVVLGENISQFQEQFALTDVMKKQCGVLMSVETVLKLPYRDAVLHKSNCNEINSARAQVGLLGVDRTPQLGLSGFNEYKIVQSNTKINMQWKFLSPLDPHFGGAYKSIIESATKANTAIRRNTNINDVQLGMAMMNAIGPIISGLVTFNDDVSLTAIYYLGRFGEQFSLMSVDQIKFYRRNRWHRIQDLVWYKCIPAREWRRGQHSQELPLETTEYSVRRGYVRDLVRYMYITEKRPRDQMYTRRTDGRV